MTKLTKIAAENFDIANAYLEYGTVEDTAEQLDIPRHEVVKALQKPETKRYLDGVYLDLGYRNRSKLGSVLDKILESKLEEAEESGIYTSKDILEIIALIHKITMDQIKANKESSDGPNIQIANIHGDSPYGSLMGRLMKNDR